MVPEEQPHSIVAAPLAETSNFANPDTLFGASMAKIARSLVELLRPRAISEACVTKFLPCRAETNSISVGALPVLPWCNFLNSLAKRRSVSARSMFELRH